MRCLLILVVACTPRVAPLAVDATQTVTVPAPTAVVPAATGTAFAVGQDWSGRYTCGRTQTLVIVNVESVEGERIHGVLLFRDQDSGDSGSYDVDGTFDSATGALSLKAGDWIDRPQGHTKADLVGLLRDRTIGGVLGTPASGSTCRLSLTLSDGLPTIALPED